MCRGVENLPITMAGLTLPTSTRLNLVHTQETIESGSLSTWVNVTGKSGLLRQLNLVVNSTDYGYQEGCVSAKIDGTNDLWLSSGLEDYFLGACESYANPFTLTPPSYAKRLTLTPPSFSSTRAAVRRCACRLTLFLPTDLSTFCF
jgi:hypothetical protein